MSKIVKFDKGFPVIVPFMFFSLLLFSIGDSGYIGELGYSYVHLLHVSTIHFILMLLGLWFFFLRLGAEIEIADIVKAGPLVLGAVLGGMIIPFFLTVSLVYLVGGVSIAVALYVSAGAMATDVPMALGSAKYMQKSVKSTMLVALMILAIGDDLGAVTVMTAMYAEGLTQFHFLAGEVMILLVAWFMGKEGIFEMREFDLDGKEISRKRFDLVFTPPIFWIVIGLLNTYYLGVAGIEPILGGCLIFIFAPTSVKHYIAEKTEVIALWLLIFFTIVAGSVNIFDSQSFGLFTVLAFAGGFMGKLIGVSLGAIHGRKFADPDSDYGKNKFGYREILSLATASAANGTVAIIFVSVGMEKGLIPSDIGNQMKMGFLFTIVGSYFLSYSLGKFWYYIDNKKEVKTLVI